MNAQREFPANPHAVVYHVDDRLTDQIVETYLHGSESPRAWAREAARLPGLRVLSLNAYKIRLQKQEDSRWPSLLASFERILRRQLEVARIDELNETESRRRKFCWHGEAFERAVYEGRLQARKNPVAEALFELAGVAEVILDGNCIEVRKSPLHGWGDLAPEVERVLAAG